MRDGAAEERQAGERQGGEGAAARAYAALRVMAMEFRFGPGAKLNEVELAEQLGVSRTPLREALHRLAAERLVLSVPGQGFRARSLDTREVFDLFEARLAVEIATVGTACERAEAADLERFDRTLDETAALMASGEAGIDVIIARDEAFHEMIASATGNAEFVWLIRHVNARIHFTRWLSTQGVEATDAEHRALVAAIRDRDRPRAEEIMRRHITRRLDQIVEIISESHVRLYRRSVEEGGLRRRASS